MKSKPQTPNNFEEKLEEILHLPHIREFYDWCAEEDIDEDVMYKIAGWLGSEIYLPADIAIKAITTLCEEEARRARIEEVQDLIVEFYKYNWTPRNPYPIFKNRLAELKRGRE